MNYIPKAYIDANVLKFAATKLLRFVPKNKRIRNWYGKVTGILVNSLEYVNLNNWITNPKLKKEAELLPQVAELIKSQRLQALMNFETEVESWGLPSIGSATGRFYGAPIKYVNSPIKHSRMTTSIFGCSPKKLQFDFLSQIKHERFIQLQTATGAYQGQNRLNRNQLLDAFYLWCAEYNKCDFFLTLDFRLIKMMKKTKLTLNNLTLVRPSGLLEKI